MTPTERYQADVASGKVMRDPEQIRVIGHLTDLCRGLEEKAKPVNGTCLQRLIYAVREKVNASVSKFYSSPEVKITESFSSVSSKLTSTCSPS